MKKLYFLRYCIVFVLGLNSIKAWTQASPSNHFRSATSGLWDIAGTWETSPDGSGNWTPSVSPPTSNDNTITIRSGHSVTISNSTTADQVVVASGGILNLATGSSSSLTIADGSGSDITVQKGGLFKHNILGSALPTFIESAILEIQSGGILEAANNNGIPSNYANAASIIVSKNNILWSDGSIFNWNTAANPTEGVTYFPLSFAIPVFRFSQPVTIGGTSPTIINGLLEANADVHFSSSGPKTFRNGITGTGKVGVTASTGGKFIIDGTAATLGGSGILELNTSGLTIGSGSTVTLTSNKVINNNGATGTITNSGTLIAGDYVVSGSSKIQIDSTIKTSNSNGLTGSATSTFATGFSVNTPGASSLIEYYKAGDQIISPLSYNNLIISGSGTKTAGPGVDVSVSGMLNIMPGCTFALNGTNNLKLNGGGTININANAVFDNGGESEVSGGSTPTVNISGTFITRDADGFTGSRTSISGTNIILKILPGSTVEYARDGDQIVTKRDDYINLTFSKSGIKTLPTCSPKGTVTIKDDAIADASNKTFGGDTITIPNLTMTGGRLKVGGTGTKPDIRGPYNLTGGVIEFTNSGRTKQTIRSPRTYFNIEVSGSNVGNSKGITTIADRGSFTVKTGGSFEISDDRIDGTEGIQRFTLEAGATFKTEVKGGFSGNDSAALKNIENPVIDPKSTIVYSRSGNQTITPFVYPKLLLTGSGNKTVAGGIVTFAAAADSVVIDTLVVFKVSPGAKVDFKGHPVLVRSSAGGTGIIGEIADGSSALLNATNVTVERFIPARRSFRFLSPSVTTTNSIKDNWMEGEVNPNTTTRINPNPGYGTNITGNSPTANGFDPTITNNPSLFTFNTSGQTWVEASNTNSSLQAGTAYRLMVRGDRSIDMTKPDNYPIPTNTNLRTTGTLKTGTVSHTFSGIAANSYIFIGNPYASPVDFQQMWSASNTNNVSSTCYVWDPRLGKRGAYVIYNASQDKNNNAESQVDKNIQSGQAFFVQINGSSPFIEFLESHKSTGITKVFRDPSPTPELSVQLLLNLNAGLENNADGVVATFDDDFTTAIGNEDSYKFTNLDENLSIDRNGSELSMEGRPSITANDTVPLKMWQLRQQRYYLKLAGNNFSPDVTAFIKDNYLNKETAVDLLSETLLPVNVDTTIAASYINRFSIVFKPGNILPVTLTSVKAYQKDNAIQVEWTAESEININHYEIEKSVNGQQFDKAIAITAKGNNSVTEAYYWLDENVNTGSTFYRIKVIEKSGAVKYSNIVKVNIAEVNSRITVFPNPVKGNVIQVQLSNMEKGRYSAVLYNSLGQKLQSSTIEHTLRSGTYTILLSRLITKGTYTLHITKGDMIITERVIAK